MPRDLQTSDTIVQVREDELDLTIEMDPGTVYGLRTITTEMARAILKKHTRMVPNKITHKRDEELNNADATDAMLDYAIVSWEGVRLAGQPAPCDLANKKLLPPEIQRALILRAQNGQVTPEEESASFRQSARVV